MLEKVTKYESCQEYSMKYIYSTSQMSKLSLTLYTFSVTSSVAGLFLTDQLENMKEKNLRKASFLTMEISILRILYYLLRLKVKLQA